MRIYIKDVFDEDEYTESILAVPKIPNDVLLSCKIAFSEFITSYNTSDDEDILFGVWRCNDVTEFIKFLEANNFEVELR